MMPFISNNPAVLREQALEELLAAQREEVAALLARKMRDELSEDEYRSLRVELAAAYERRINELYEVSGNTE